MMDAAQRRVHGPPLPRVHGRRTRVHTPGRARAPRTGTWACSPGWCAAERRAGRLHLRVRTGSEHMQVWPAQPKCVHNTPRGTGSSWRQSARVGLLHHQGNNNAFCHRDSIDITEIRISRRQLLQRIQVPDTYKSVRCVLVCGYLHGRNKSCVCTWQYGLAYVGAPAHCG